MSDNCFKILDLVDNHKEAIGDGDYLKICNLLKNINNKPTGRKFVQSTAHTYQIRSLSDCIERKNREIAHLQNLLMASYERQVGTDNDEELARLRRLEKRVKTLHKVKGIGKKTFESIMNHVRK